MEAIATLLVLGIVITLLGGGGLVFRLGRGIVSAIGGLFSLALFGALLFWLMPRLAASLGLILLVIGLAIVALILLIIRLARGPGRHPFDERADPRSPYYDPRCDPYSPDYDPYYANSTHRW